MSETLGINADIMDDNALDGEKKYIKVDYLILPNFLIIPSNIQKRYMRWFCFPLLLFKIKYYKNKNAIRNSPIP